MDGSTMLMRNPDPMTAEIDGEVLMLDATQGVYFGLDRTGTAMWELLAQPRSVDGLCAALADRFDVTAERCRTDVVAFLHELRAAGLVRVVTG